jgi:hypothetical protein
MGVNASCPINIKCPNKLSCVCRRNVEPDEEPEADEDNSVVYIYKNDADDGLELTEHGTMTGDRLTVSDTEAIDGRHWNTLHIDSHGRVVTLCGALLGQVRRGKLGDVITTFFHGSVGSVVAGLHTLCVRDDCTIQVNFRRNDKEITILVYALHSSVKEVIGVNMVFRPKVTNSNYNVTDIERIIGTPPRSKNTIV